MTTERKTHRVRYSDRYRERFYPKEQRHGDCYETETYCYVRWDGLISFQAYAKDYVERAD